MAEDDIFEFLQTKNRYIEDDYKLRLCFDFIFFDNNESTYHNKAELLDKKIDKTLPESPTKMKKFLNTNPFKKATRKGIAVYGVSTCTGFLDTEKFNFKTEAGNASKEIKETHFLEAFEKFVISKDLIPDRSLILLTQDKHHMTRASKRKISPLNTSTKKLKAPGTPKITDFFQKTKTVNIQTIKKATPDPSFTYRVEEIVYKHRGDKVSVLFIPTRHSELDPLSFITILLKSEIARFLGDNKEETTQRAIEESLKIFPDESWSVIMTHIRYFEAEYLKRNGDAEFDEDIAESDDESTVENEPSN